MKKWKSDQGKWKKQIGAWESEGQSAKRPTPQERNTFSTEIVPEKAILVAVCAGGATLERTEEYLNELEFLLETAGGITLKKVIQKLQQLLLKYFDKFEDILYPLNFLYFCLILKLILRYLLSNKIQAQEVIQKLCNHI